ncbi:phosphate ABC transporter permease subunit PstC [Myxococcota bacterium]|nr:phosphate ABC transporter permease subunit PstC [Myxococcota bacterium]
MSALGDVVQDHARAAPTPRASSTLAQRPLRAHRPKLHTVAEWMIRIFAGAAIAAIVLIFAFIAKETIPLFTSSVIHEEVTLAKMWFAQLWEGYETTEHVWQPVSDVPKYAVWPLLVGTLKVTLVSVAIAAPVSVAAALYVAHLASPRVRELVKPAIELLAGIPSVVLGFFSLIVLATWVQDLFGLDYRLSALLAGIGLSFALMPVIFTISEEAFRSVPKSYVEASAALGARRWQTMLFVVTPAASPGIAAAIALAFGRAIGETMIVLMASGNAAILSASVTESTRTLSATIAAELAEVVFGGAHYTVLFFLGALLFVITFFVNLAGSFAVERMRKSLGGHA